MGPSSFGEFMTAANNSLSLILRRLDEIERKLDHVLEELRTPAAIGYSVRRGFLMRGGGLLAWWRRRQKIA
jgi:hypothetical protein